MRCSKASCLLLALLVALSSFLAGRAFAAAGDFKIVVLPFEINAGEDMKYLADSLPELLTDRLKAVGFSVVAQEDVRRVLREKRVEALDLKAAKALGAQFGANMALYGSFNQVGEILSIDARLVDVVGAKPAVPLFVTREGLINLMPAADELVAKTSASLLQEERIAELDVEGTSVLDKEVVLMRLTIKKGDVYNPKAISTDLKNVYELGYFDDVKVAVSETAGGGKKITFLVKEKPRILALGVKGAKEIDQEDVLKAVTTKKGAVLNPKTLLEDLKIIREMYRKGGFYKATVTHELEDAGTGQARLNFVIEEGKKLYIEKIVIEGAKQLSQGEIKDKLALKEHGILSWYTKTGVLKEELLERDAAALTAFYQTKGFIDAKVGQPEVEIKDDGITLVFRVFEGARYKIGKISFEGDLIAAPEKLKSVTKISELAALGEYFNRGAVQDDVKALSNYYNDFGYAYAEASVRLDDHPEELTVDVVYTLAKHQKVHIRRVQIVGNTKTRDNVILRELRLADGAQFSGEKLRRSIERLNKLDYFSEADIEPLPTGDPDAMDLKVKVKDKPTGRIGGGIGYSSYQSVYLAADITEKNLFGKGYIVGLNGAFGSKTIGYTASFMNPRYNDTLLGVGGQAYHRTEDFTDFKKQTVGGQANFSYPMGEYTTLFWNYTLENYDIYDLVDTASDDIKSNQGAHINSAVTLVLRRDTTDKPFNPSTGSIWSFLFLTGGGILAGNDSYVKYGASADYFVPAPLDMTFHSRTAVGFLHENFDRTDIPLTQKFRLGGIGSVRGYGTGKIAPQDDVTGEVIGGTKSFFANLEMLYPLSKEMGITLVGFFDAGGVWKPGEFYFQAPKRMNDNAPPLGLYKSVGAGIRWNSPMGPIRIEYGHGLDKLYDSGTDKIEFGMGQTF